MSDPPTVFICEEVAAVRRMYGPAADPLDATQPICDLLDSFAARLHAAHRNGDAAAASPIRCWHPDRIGWSADAILRQPFALRDARLTLAREHGFADWARVKADGTPLLDAKFERAVEALLRGDVETLRRAAVADPTLASRRSRLGHRATLLHYVGSNGVETYRQVVPSNLAAVVETLLAIGCDRDATAAIYGWSRVCELLLSSEHPREAGVLDAAATALGCAKPT